LEVSLIRESNNTSEVSVRLNIDSTSDSRNTNSQFTEGNRSECCLTRESTNTSTNKRRSFTLSLATWIQSRIQIHIWLQRPRQQELGGGLWWTETIEGMARRQV
jgi:hypothetical protein